MRAMLRRVQPKVTRLFLYDFSRKQLHGVFVAVAPPEMNIDPSAWGAPGRKSSRFPAQVRVERVPGTNRVGDGALFVTGTNRSIRPLDRSPTR